MMLLTAFFYRPSSMLDYIQSIITLRLTMRSLGQQPELKRPKSCNQLEMV
jgi:hypothetical protein